MQQTGPLRGQHRQKSPRCGDRGWGGTRKETEWGTARRRPGRGAGHRLQLTLTPSRRGGATIPTALAGNRGAERSVDQGHRTRWRQARLTPLQFRLLHRRCSGTTSRIITATTAALKTESLQASSEGTRGSKWSGNPTAIGWAPHQGSQALYEHTFPRIQSLLQKLPNSYEAP